VGNPTTYHDPIASPFSLLLFFPYDTGSDEDVDPPSPEKKRMKEKKPVE
jgi:hypothetical protein